jgi:hypothetical protein
MLSRKNKLKSSKIPKSKKRVKKMVKKNTRKNKKTPRRKYKKTTKRRRFFGGDGGDENCPICFAPLANSEQVFTTNCNHKFHLGCIETWCSGKRVCECPLCRTELNPNPNPNPIQDDSEDDMSEEDVINALFNERGLWNYTVRQNSTPEEVFSAMSAVLELWNQIFDNNPQGLDEEHMDFARLLIDRIYDRLVRVTPQGVVSNNDGLPEIINRRSNAILSDFFDYVANINSDNLNPERINGRIEIPEYQSYDGIPNEDHSDFESDDGTEDEMDISQ